MGLKLRYGDYIPDGTGGLCRAEGQEAILEQVLYQLTARRGTFPFLETLGSRLWQLGRVPTPQQQSAVEQYVAEALADIKGLSIERVTLEELERTTVTVELFYRGEHLTAAVEIP